MKNLILISLLALSTISYGQKLYVTPNGLRDANDNEKTFVVLTVEEMTSRQLYDNALKYVNKNYKNPDEVIKGKTEGEYIKFNTYYPEFVLVKNGGVKVIFAATYTTELSFKDNKVKYEVIELNMYNPNNNMPFTFTGGGMDWCIYNKKGELKREDAKAQIEDYFKADIYKITEALKGTEADNW